MGKSYTVTVPTGQESGPDGGIHVMTGIEGIGNKHANGQKTVFSRLEKDCRRNKGGHWLEVPDMWQTVPEARRAI